MKRYRIWIVCLLWQATGFFIPLLTSAYSETLQSAPYVVKVSNWPDHWVQFKAEGSNATFTWDPIVYWSASHSISIQDPTGWAVVASENHSLYDPDKIYQATAYVKTQALTPNAAAVKLDFFDENHNWIGELRSQEVGGTTEWVQVTVETSPQSIPPKTRYLGVAIIVSKATGIAWFDDVLLFDGESVLNENAMFE